MKYEFIVKHKNLFPIGKMAIILDVSRSSYYKYLNREIPNRERETEKIKEAIKEKHKDCKGIYGSPRIYEDLIDSGYSCGLNKVANLMKTMNLKSIRSKKFRVVTTDSDHDYRISENILNRQFDVSEANKIWVSDITYIDTAEGWLYLCTVLDLFSRSVVGWSMEDHMRTEMVIKALDMAYEKREPSAGLIFHSDRGSQYASDNFRNKLDD